MNITSLNNISFQKNLVAKCAIREGQNYVPAKIFQLENGDEDYFKKFKYDSSWKGNLYSIYMDYGAENGFVNDMYVIENNGGECLGYLKTDQDDKTCVKYIQYIETKPKHTDNEKKYIGETLLNFFVQQSRRENKQYICACDVDDDAIGFYTQYGFISGKEPIPNYYFNVNNNEELETMNYEHTNSKIEFVG